jgi:myo-inositol-1(or 4)-monophosphatase
VTQPLTPATSAPVPFGAELDFALRTAAAAADLLLSRAGADDVRDKGRADLVTAVDEAAERLIEGRIRDEFPDDGFVGEEFSTRSTHVGRRWIADPVDGTVNFVHGHPFSCVSLGLVDERGPAVGVIHAPFLGEVFHAVRGGGAWLNGAPIRVSAMASGAATLIATGFPFKPGKGDPTVYLQLVGDFLRTTHGVRRAGSAALDLAYVACGRVDGYFEIGLQPWDIAAGLLLVEEAGGQVSGWPGDDRPPLDSGRVLASNGRVHGWLAGMVEPYVGRL